MHKEEIEDISVLRDDFNLALQNMRKQNTMVKNGTPEVTIFTLKNHLLIPCISKTPTTMYKFVI